MNSEIVATTPDLKRFTLKQKNMSRKIPDPDNNDLIVTRNKAALMVALKNLMVLGNMGNTDAVSLIVENGLLCAKFLEESAKLPHISRKRQAVEHEARLAMEWPIVCPAFVELRKASMEGGVPPMLGEGQRVRVNKKTPTTKASRKFHWNSRTGFAFSYYQRLLEAYEWTRRYSSPGEFYTRELKKRAAFRIISALQGHTSKKLGSVWIKDEATVVSVMGENWIKLWPEISVLPEFGSATVVEWTNAGVMLANADCGGSWSGGNWPQKLAGDAVARITEEGVDNEYAYKEAVFLWIKAGLKSLTKRLQE